MSGIIVVGAGLLGASLAHQLATRGAPVTLVDSGPPGGGTSGSSFAWVNAQEKAPAAYFELNRDGVAAYADLAAALGGDWFHAGGDLAVGRGPGAAKLQDKIERHLALGYPVRSLDRAGVLALEPALDLGDDDGPFVAAHFPDEGWLDARALVDRLVEAATTAGAALMSDDIASIAVHEGRATGVRTATGAVHVADHVVIAAGPASEALAATAHVRLPMAPSPGLLVRTEPTATRIGRVIHAGDVALRPDGDDRLLVSSREADAALEPSTRDLAPDAPAVADVLARAARLVPGLRGVAADEVRIGIRSVPVDGVPAVGPAPAVDGLYVVVSHSGATLAPILGRLVADELLGEPVARLDPYRLDRFVLIG